MEKTINAVHRGAPNNLLIVCCIVLAIATLLLYAPVRHHEFLVYDDAPYIFRNLHVSTGLTLQNARWAFTSFHEGNWHPVTWLSHMADCAVFGLSPGPQHIVNVVLHLANVLLLFLLLNRATRALWRSFIVAALFAVHPMNVETVAWVAERKSLLSAFFSLLAIVAYGLYVRSGEKRRYLLVGVAFAFALMSKPMAVSLPLLLLSLDYWPLNRYPRHTLRIKWGRLVREKVPLFLMSAASCAVTVIAQRAGHAMAEPDSLALSIRIQNAIVSYVEYIGKLLWPARLAVFYPHPEHALPWLHVICSASILLIVTAAVLWRRRSRYLVMGWFVFLVSLLPVVGIVQVGSQAMADRYAYIPSIGLFIAIVWGIAEVTQRTCAGVTKPRIATVLALCVIGGFAITASQYLQYWQNGGRLFHQAARVAGHPDSMIEKNIADAAFFAGNVDEAFLHYAQACSLRPSDAFCHFNMAEILFSRNQLSAALEQYQLAGRFARHQDMTVECLTSSAEILLQFGDLRGAEIRLAAALQLDPDNQAALLLLQRCLNQKGLSSFGSRLDSQVE